MTKTDYAGRQRGIIGGHPHYPTRVWAKRAARIKTAKLSRRRNR